MVKRKPDKGGLIIIGIGLLLMVILIILTVLLQPHGVNAPGW